MMIERVARPFAFTIYLLTGVFGLGTLLYPAPSIEGVVGLSIVWLYGLCALVGALGAMFFIIRPNYKLELIFLWPITMSWSLYDLSLWGIYTDRITHPDDSPAPYGPAIGILLLSLFLVWRLIFISAQSRRLLKGTANGHR